MKKHLIICALLLFFSVSKADNPGYMGLQFLVKYDAGIFHPAIVGRTGMLPSVQHNLSFEYTVSRAWAFGARYGFMIYRHEPNPHTFYLHSGQNYSISNKDYTAPLMQHVVSVYVKKFPLKKGHIAPFGRYFLFGMYYQYATDYDSQLISYSDGNGGISRSEVNSLKATAHFGGIMLGAGRNFIVANRMVIDFGFVINCPLTIFPKTDWIEINKNLLLRNLFQLNLGIGVLAF